MSKNCSIHVNDEVISARRGSLLLDAALASGVEIPHDCRAGQCGTCRVRVVDGTFWGGECEEDGYVHACQCRVISDLSLEMEPALDVLETSGRVAELVQLAPDVVEVCIEASHPIDFYRGQYYSVRFAGFPARPYSPTIALDWPSEPGFVRFNIRQIENGLVSSALGRTIERGHRVTLTGPYGSAYFRPDHPGRIVLVAGGTGFAPIWAIAEAAIRERPDREMHIIVGTRSIEGLYMIPALCRIALFPGVTIIPVVSEPQQLTPSVKVGLPTEFLPDLRPDDMVYVSGAPAMVTEVAARARASGARCHCDAFVPQQQPSPMRSVGSSLRSLMEGVQTSVRSAFAFRALRTE